MLRLDIILNICYLNNGNSKLKEVTFMKKMLILVLTVILALFSLAGCKEKTKSTASEDAEIKDMDITYIYVTALGDDWIYGNDTKVICGKDHGYKMYNTVKVEYYKSDMVEEHGTVTVNIPDHTFNSSYNKIIKKVVYTAISKPEKGEPVFDKPVIYLYPEKTTDISVKLDFDGYFTETIPPYRDGWHVIASPDGQLTADDGKTYPYLFWEGVPNKEFTITEGFCVAGNKTREFFETILPEIGLAEKEYTEFIEYWLPNMENNEYNLIQFYGEQYLEAAKLDVTPAPDSVLRVFMAYRSSDEYVSLAEQTFTPFVRTGFTVVEWGGTCLD